MTNQQETISHQADHQAQLALKQFSLPFSQRTWKSPNHGKWRGNDSGNSIDFQDCRDYQWGDDPRAIYWAAYARTGQLLMKLYQAERSPVVDIMFDVSASMFMTEAKAVQSEALLRFCVFSALENHAPLRIHALTGDQSIPLTSADVQAGTWKKLIQSTVSNETMPSLPPGNRQGMTIMISDLLFPGNPEQLLQQLGRHNAHALILSPALAEEAHLDVSPSVLLKNCETRSARLLRISPDLAERYAQTYKRHFALWKECCRRYAISQAMVSADISLPEALVGEALTAGCIVLNNHFL